jgi:hypothetical protein
MTEDEKFTLIHFEGSVYLIPDIVISQELRELIEFVANVEEVKGIPSNEKKEKLTIISSLLSEEVNDLFLKQHQTKLASVCYHGDWKEYKTTEKEFNSKSGVFITHIYSWTYWI